jgi:predicted metal-binding protein
MLFRETVNSRCFLCESCETHKCILWETSEPFDVKAGGIYDLSVL